MNIPPSMVDDLGAWNDGAGIDLESWVGCEGRFALAVGYAAIFWPKFVAFEDYVLREGFSEASLRGFERQREGDRETVERVMNHRHLEDIQYVGCPDISKDKLLKLGHTLVEIYAAKLKWQFPQLECETKFSIPENEDDLREYQITFWKKRP